ncbi:unnamed protein product [Microthlaspi erraticum]|uniref:polynucleotide adenylyltransferase n=1 Tax=Microthlaspi erraticum TaxID=1685480 RepID=A0A6D2JVS7_9BRAS|nr:unnamed protein product [Microthlaspi erraticum]
MEESQAKMEAPAFLYDTLPALSFSDSNQSPTSNQSPATLGDSHFYSVFRNDIADLTVDTTPVESETVDFLSLDVDDAGATENGGGFVTPVVASKKSRKRKKGKEAEEPRLETNNWFSESSFSKIPMLQLHKEIVDFCDFLLPTQEEKALRDAAMDNVRSVIQYIWPNCKVEVFGSYRTGLYLPTSDIDVVILESGITNPQLGLRALSRALSQRGIAKNILVIAKARVPIIKFVEKKSSISFDLSFDMENGPKAAEFIQDAVLRLPPLRPLCLILKVFLQQRELNEVYSGGIGSYALLAMLISFLKYLKDGRSPPEHNLGVLLVKFFDFYGRKLNTADVGVSCKRGGSFFSKSNKGFWNPARPGLISIEDPQTPENDIGKSSFNYFQIRSAFAMALSTLTNAKSILALGPNRSILGTIIRPDRTLLERKGGKNGDVTFNSLLPGAGEPLPMQGNENGLFCNWDLGEEEEEGSFPRTPLVVETPGSKTKESSRKKKKKSSKKKMVVVSDDDEEEEKETSSKKRRRKNKAKNGKKAAAAGNDLSDSAFSFAISEVFLSIVVVFISSLSIRIFMEGTFFRFDHGDGYVLTQKPPNLVTLPTEELHSDDHGCFDCNICLDTAHDPVVTLCGHLFCWPCIYRWLDVQKSSPVSIIQHQNCPVCKSNISIGSLVPLYGRGMTSSSSSSEATMIPKRPTSSPLNNLIHSASSLNPSLHHHHHHHHHHQGQSPRHFTATESSTDLANAVMMSFLYPVIGMFGDMVYARMFGTFTNAALAHPYENARRSIISGSSNQRMLQVEKYMHRVSIFFLCCILLCLFLF